ncbi:MAG: hypothetical protein AAF725_22785 [Acidobacteriota bacterium]
MFRCLFFATVFLPLSLLATPAAAQQAWIIDSMENDTALSVFDFTDPVPARVATINIPFGNGMTGGGPNGDLYLIDRPLGTNTMAFLSRLDPIDLELEVIGPINTPNTPLVRDLAVLPDGRILMSAEVGTGAGLYTLDPATGAATLITQMADPPDALAVLNGRVYAGARIDPPNNLDFALFELDPQTGALTLLFTVPGDVFGGMSSMTSSPTENLLYVTSSFVVGSPPFLRIDNTVIDPASGVIETFSGGRANTRPLQGLALVENSVAVAVPSLSGASMPVFLALLLAAGLAVIRYRSV